MSAEVVGGYGPTGSSGHSGSAASEARAAREDSTGITRDRDREVFEYVANSFGDGRTCFEVETFLGLGHGQASGALSRLHREGRLARLAERRDRQHPYILTDYAKHRELSEYRPNAAYRAERKAAPLDPGTLPDDTIAEALERARLIRFVSVAEARRFLVALAEADG